MLRLDGPSCSVIACLRLALAAAGGGAELALAPASWPGWQLGGREWGATVAGGVRRLIGVLVSLK